MDKQFDELLAKHLNGTIQKDEKKMLAFLLESPENQLYLAATIDKAFLEDVSNEGIDATLGVELFARIKQKTGEETADNQIKASDYQTEVFIGNNGYRRKLYQWMAIAASVLAIVVIGLLINNQHRPDGVVVKDEDNKPIVTQTRLVHYINTSGKDTTIHLVD